LGRLSWRPATVSSVLDETAETRTLTLTVPGWTGHRPGQHVDIRLTAPDGYTAVRPYSIATPHDGERVDITVSLVEEGEVSSYLVRETQPGSQLEVRGPLGGWFVWDPTDDQPVQLVGGGVGVAPLMSMLRAHDTATQPRPMRLLYSTRTLATLLYRDELAHRAGSLDPATSVQVLYTREAPDTAARPAGRISASDVAAYALPATPRTRCYVCGSTGFVEASIELLLGAGFDGDNIRAERFGP
jgi:ferredoxin-NADP reductase